MRSQYSDREIQHVNSVFPVDFYLGQEVTLYIKIRNQTSLYFPVTIWSPNTFVTSVSTIEFIYGLFFGSMIVLLVYNLFLYVSVRDISYLYYVLYLGGITVFDFLEIGHGMIHVDDLVGTINRGVILFVIWETAVAGILFSKYFMSVKEK